MSNSQTAHEWAHKTGRKQNGSNLFYERNIIYSYGYHFPIAKHIEGGKVLFTTRGYSVSTSKHISYVMKACNHLDKIYVNNPKAESKSEHLDNVNTGLKEAGNWLEKAKKARTRGDDYRAQALNILDNMREYASLYLPRHKFDFNPDNVQAEQEKIQAKEARRKARELKKRAQAEKERLDKWVSGDESVHGFFPNSDIKLRVKGENVETSQGAEVPLVDAVPFFELCKRIKASGKSLKSFTHKVGSFLPTSIDKAGNAVIGCHTLSFKEMERIHSTL